MAWINYWLHEAGFQVIHSHDFKVPISYGTRAHSFFYRQLWVFVRQIRPFLLQAGVIREDTLDELCVQVQEEVKSKQFEAYGRCTCW